MTISPSSQAIELLTEALGQGQLLYLEVTSGSMEPLFKCGDQIQLGETSAAELTAGDIVVLSLEGQLVAHRFWNIMETHESSYLATRGDRLAYFDSPSPVEQLQAIVIARRRAGTILDLSTGRGAWLNRMLAQLSAIEAKVIGLDRPAPGQRIGRAPQISFPRRVIRRFLAISGALLAIVVDQFGRRRRR